jgi:hypothetical protein
MPKRVFTLKYKLCKLHFLVIADIHWHHLSFRERYCCNRDIYFLKRLILPIKLALFVAGTCWSLSTLSTPF